MQANSHELSVAAKKKSRTRPPRDFVYNRIVHQEGQWCAIELRPGIFAKIDFSDYESIKDIKWHVWMHPTAGYLVKSSSRMNGKSGEFTLQSYLLKTPKGMFPTFVNRSERLDFRRANLQIVSVQIKNHREGKRKAPSSSVFRGVSVTKSNTWRAAIQVNGVGITLGSYESEVEAALVYNMASQFYFGDEGHQNDFTATRTIKQKRLNPNF